MTGAWFSWWWAAVVAAAGVGMFVPVVWRHARWLVVTVHEFGHGVAALLTGGRVRSFHLTRYQGGLTVWAAPKGRFRRVVVTCAGHASPGVLAAAGFWAHTRGWDREFFAVAAVLSGVSCVLWRGWRMWVVGLLFTGLLGLVAWQGSVARVGVAVTVGVFSVGGVRDALNAVRSRPVRGDGSDVGMVAALTFLPVPVVIFGMFAGTVVPFVVTVWLSSGWW